MQGSIEQRLAVLGWYREQYVRVRGEWLFQSLACFVEEHAPTAQGPRASGLSY